MHTERLCKQREIKRRQKQQPVVVMSKREVRQQKLESYILHDADDEVLTFSQWWQMVADDEDVEVQFPYERHGLAGRYRNMCVCVCMFLLSIHNITHQKGAIYLYHLTVVSCKYVPPFCNLSLNTKCKGGFMWDTTLLRPPFQCHIIE